jgi:hypothetical protein
MDKKTFLEHLIQATDIVILFSRELVMNRFPSDCKYLIFPNQSYDGNPLEGDEEVFPEESLSQGQCIGPLDRNQAVENLWRNSKIPEWINVSVYSYDHHYSYLELICCGRFTAQQEHQYHIHEGYPPFHVLGPPEPPGWESVEKDGKFDLYWMPGKRKPSV